MSLILPWHIAETRRLQLRCQQWANDVLQQAYPRHAFKTYFDPADQSYRIEHMLMGTSQACMYVHPGEPDVAKALVRVAGEILERVNLPRKGLEDWQQYKDAEGAAKEAFECR